MGKSGGTIGYHYLLTLVMNLCRGPIDELVEIQVGDEVAWRGSAADATPKVINQPNLFGGDDREGGIQGAFRLLQGEPTQVLPPDTSVYVTGASEAAVRSTVIRNLKTLIGVPMGEMRGYAALVYDGLVCSMSPYPKQWKMRLRRTSAGWYGGACWYPEKARVLLLGDGDYGAGTNSSDPLTGVSDSDAIYRFREDSAGDSSLRTVMQYLANIGSKLRPVNQYIHAMNPAHIIYQCLTDPEWGAGQSASRIDENSFILAANQLCSEGFGLCFNWTRQEDVDTFVQVVIDHIGGVIYNDRETGKYVLRLIRGDYDPDAIPTYGFATGLLAISEEDNASNDGNINEVVVTGKDPVTNQNIEVRAQSLAGMQAAGGEIVSHSVEYKGVPTRALGLRLAERDLRSYTSGLKRYRLLLDRRAWQIAPGMVLKVVAPERGLDSIVLRVGEVDYGDLENGTISVRVVEDVFGMPETTFSEAVAGSFTGTLTYPLLSPVRALVEASYRDAYRRAGATEAGNLAATSAIIAQFALAPTGSSVQYDLASQADGETAWRMTSNQAFTAFARLAAAIGPGDTTITLADNYGIDEGLLDTALLLGGPDGEVVRLTAITGNTATIARGCVDTVPASHAAGTNVWGQDDSPGADGREYAIGETVSTQVLTRTSNALLDQDDAPTDVLTVTGRHAMPYPPGNVTVDGDSIFALAGNIYDEPVIAWTHRDRIAQADQLVAFGDGSVGPEPGTTYRIRIYDPASLTTPVRTVTGIAATSWTYDAAMQVADALPLVVVRLDSERDGLNSWQFHQFTVQVDGGYGFTYGNDYGGA